MPTPGYLNRFEMLVGTPAMERLSHTKVAIFGVGGVGGWCAEAVARNGVGNITLVDSDFVCPTNINRQIQATHVTVGGGKVDVLGNRLQEIRPDAKITKEHRPFTRDTQARFCLEEFDYVVDAIDSLGNKVDLIESALATQTTLFSALGASNKLDPSRVRIESFWKVRGCPLGKHLRKRVRNRGVTKDFLVVFSDENLARHDVRVSCNTGECLCPDVMAHSSGPDWCESKKQINGSAIQVTATFGLFLAGLITKDVVQKL